MGLPAQRLVFSRRLAALTNATETDAGRDFKTQKSSDLARRKAVGCNTVLACWLDTVLDLSIRRRQNTG